MIWPGRCCGWLQVWQLELYTGCLLSLVVGVVYLPLFWPGNLDHSSYPCSWGSGHVPPGVLQLAVVLILCMYVVYGDGVSFIMSSF